MRRQKPDARVKQEAALWDIKVDDLVEVNTGPEAGRRGRVLRCNTRYNEVVVEGINVISKEVMDTESSPFDPAFLTNNTPRPIYFRNVSLVDPVLDKRTEVEWSEVDGRRVRIAAESGAEVPLPARPPPWEGVDFAESLCTRRADVLEVTYKPLPDYSLSRMRAEARAEAAKADDASGVPGGQSAESSEGAAPDPTAGGR